MRNLILITLGMVTLIISCHPDRIDDQFLNQWLGTYSGEAFHWSSHPSFPIGTGWTLESDTHKVIVQVTKGDSIFSLDFAIAYDDSIFKNNENLIFTDSGYHFSNWGVGSNEGSLEVQFTHDSLFYSYNQRCGIPCTYGYTFRLKR